MTHAGRTHDVEAADHTFGVYDGEEPFTPDGVAPRLLDEGAGDAVLAQGLAPIRLRRLSKERPTR